MGVVLAVVVFAAGAFMVAGTVGSAVRTVVLPRGIPAKLSSAVFIGVRKVFNLRLRGADTYEERDAVMALYAPLSLLLLALSWLVIVLLGYWAVFVALGVRPIHQAFVISGSSLFTLGFDHPPDLPSVIASFSEALLGLTLAALLITYLPSLYAAFSKRESMVTMLEVRAGNPPSGVEMIERFYRLHSFDELERVWDAWETWFVELEETHTSLPSLVFFRSPQPEHSWVTASGAVLDGAALYRALITDRSPHADLCIRAGYLALRRISDFFAIPYDPDPSPDDPITVARDEFDEVCKRLASAGVPIKADLEQAWRDYRGWRVNYDVVLVTLASLVMAPYASWSSDRSMRFRVRVIRKVK